MFVTVNLIEDVGASNIAKGLAEGGFLKSLSLNNNKLSDGIKKSFKECLKKNATLISLDLSHNSIGGSGASGIGSGLKYNNALNSFDLSYNNIGSSGASGIGEGLKYNNALKSLDLRHNNIGDSGASEIGDALKYNTALSSLDFSDNPIGNLFCANVFSTLSEINKTLKNLYMNKTSADPYSLGKLKEAINIPPEWKKSIPRDFRSDSSDDDDDSKVASMPSKKKSANESSEHSSSAPAPVPAIDDFLFNSKEAAAAASAAVSAQGPQPQNEMHKRHSEKGVWEKDSEELYCWLKEIFQDLPESVCDSFIDNGVTWDTLCDETQESFVKYGVDTKLASEIVEVIMGEKIEFLLPKESDEYMKIPEVLRKMNVKWSDLNLDVITQKSNVLMERKYLTVEDIAIINSYTLNKSDGSKTIYSIVNTMLSRRHLGVPYQWYVFHLLRALRKLDPYDNVGCLYRCIKRHVDISKYKIGKSRKWIPFTSTSNDNDAASSFLGNGGSKMSTMFKISGPVKGYNIKSLSKFEGEHEVLLEPFFTFKTLSIQNAGSMETVEVESEYDEKFFISNALLAKIAAKEPMPSNYIVTVEGEDVYYTNKETGEKTKKSPNSLGLKGLQAVLDN